MYVIAHMFELRTFSQAGNECQQPIEAFWVGFKRERMMQIPRILEGTRQK